MEPTIAAPLKEIAQAWMEHRGATYDFALWLSKNGFPDASKRLCPVRRRVVGRPVLVGLPTRFNEGRGPQNRFEEQEEVPGTFEAYAKGLVVFVQGGRGDVDGLVVRNAKSPTCPFRVRPFVTALRAIPAQVTFGFDKEMGDYLDGDEGLLYMQLGSGMAESYSYTAISSHCWRGLVEWLDYWL